MSKLNIDGVIFSFATDTKSEHNKKKQKIVLKAKIKKRSPKIQEFKYPLNTQYNILKRIENILYLSNIREG